MCDCSQYWVPSIPVNRCLVPLGSYYTVYGYEYFLLLATAQAHLRHVTPPARLHGEYDVVLLP